MLKIQSDRLREEIDQIYLMIAEIKQRVDAGVPGDDVPANDMNQEIFQVQLQGELTLAGHRLITLAEVIGD